MPMRFITKRQKGKTFKRSFPPEAVSDLHVVVPAQVTPEDVHGREIQNNLGDRRKEKINRSKKIGPVRGSETGCLNLPML